MAKTLNRINSYLIYSTDVCIYLRLRSVDIVVTSLQQFNVIYLLVLFSLTWGSFWNSDKILQRISILLLYAYS